MLSPRVVEGHQIPLIHEVHADDQCLLNTLEGEWFEILHDFPWAGLSPLTRRLIMRRSMNLISAKNQPPSGEARDLGPETKEQAQPAPLV